MKKKLKPLIITSSVVILFILLTFVFFAIEFNSSNPLNFTCFRDAIWYSVSSFFAISYGDIHMLSLGGKILEIVFILLGICFLGIIIGRTTNFFAKLLEERKLGYMGTVFENHAVIIGWDDVAEDITTQLVNADKKVAILTDDKDNIDRIHHIFNKKNVFACFCDTNKLRDLGKVNMSKAHTVFLNNGSDTNKLVSIINIQRQYPHILFVVLLENPNLKDTFFSAGVTYVLSKNEIASKMLASYIFEPAVADFTVDLMTTAHQGNEKEYDFQQYRVIDENPYLNKRYGEMFNDLKSKHNIVTIGLNKSLKSKGLIKLPSDDEIVELGDDIIVIVNGEKEAILKDLFRTSEGI